MFPRAADGSDLGDLRTVLDGALVGEPGGPTEAHAITVPNRMSYGVAGYRTPSMRSASAVSSVR